MGILCKNWVNLIFSILTDPKMAEWKNAELLVGQDFLHLKKCIRQISQHLVLKGRWNRGVRGGGAIGPPQFLALIEAKPCFIDTGPLKILTFRWACVGGRQPAPNYFCFALT